METERGTPSMIETFIPHSLPAIHPDDIRAVVSVLESEMIAGPSCATAFETAVSMYVGRAHAAAVSSGTAPDAEEAWRMSLSLPLYPSLSDGEVDRVIEAVTETCLKK